MYSFFPFTVRNEISLLLETNLVPTSDGGIDTSDMSFIYAIKNKHHSVPACLLNYPLRCAYTSTLNLQESSELKQTDHSKEEENENEEEED